ncbi:MAG: hypothetical protein M3N82_01040 [Pseudomonadota bacterium]|nr:hypothetical protein [Pseudomonadota bacterium]
MRRFLSALLLALCLVSSQQGALLHALRHDLTATGLAIDDEKSRPAGIGCSVCLAFAHVAGAVTSAVIAPVLLSLEFHWPVAQAFLQRPAEAPRARSRGPPAVF